MDTNLLKEVVMEKLFEYFQNERFQQELIEPKISGQSDGTGPTYKLVDIENGENPKDKTNPAEGMNEEIVRDKKNVGLGGGRAFLEHTHEQDKKHKYIDEILFTFIEIMAKIIGDDLYTIVPRVDRSMVLYEKCTSLFGEYIIPYLKDSLQKTKTFQITGKASISGDFEPLLSVL